ncbi:MAG: hypothetical protein ABIN91_19795, partial [Mucilaginibacter sp.]|uniref:hypothetical protein n=1 Tax=Mucilaginibacter sp. TaxID=1882438 RepID=UPI00326560D7
LGFFETQESRAKNQDKKEQEAGSLKPEALVVDADGDLGFVAGTGTKKDENIPTLSPLAGEVGTDYTHGSLRNYSTGGSHGNPISLNGITSQPQSNPSPVLSL